MLERFPGLFEIPLEERQDSPNTILLYLILGAPGQRSLLVDAGYAGDWCLNQLLTALDSLGLAPDVLDVFLTHKHADHCGLAHALQERGARLFMNREEDRHQYDCLFYQQDHSYANAQRRVLTRNGITPEAAPLIWAKFMEVNEHLNSEHDVWMMTMRDFSCEDIRPGQLFQYGSYQLEAVALRGHTYGQMGLVEREKRLFFAADQVLNHTIPIVGTSYADEHLLKCYLESLETICSTYADCTILPAHEGPIADLDGAVQRIRSAYRKKLEQTRNCVEPEREQTVWQIAKRVYGLTPAKRSDAAFYTSKMITTKTFSLLEYLHDTGCIQRREENGTLYWKLPDGGTC